MGTSAEQTAQKKGVVIKTLKAKHGHVSHACEAANIGRSQYYAWLREDKDFKQAVDDVNEAMVDNSESLLARRCNGYAYEEVHTVTERVGDKSNVIKTTTVKKIMPPNVEAIKTHLKAKGQDRGYGDKLHIGGIKDAPPIEITAIKVVTRKDKPKSEES